jgi:heptosyltransferase-2
MKGKLTKQKKIDSIIGGLINQLIISIKFFGKREIEKHPKRILFIKTEAVGDSILCMPMIKKVKEKTHAKIYVLCSKVNSFVFEKQDFVDEIILINQKKFDSIQIYKIIKKLRKEKIDIAIDLGQSSNISAILGYLISKSSVGFKKLKGTSRNKVYDYAVNLDTNKHMAKCYFDLVKSLGIEEPTEIKLEKIHGIKNKKVLKLFSGKKNLVGIHASNILDYKVWPRERFVELIKYLIKNKNKTIVLIGSPEEKEDNKKIIKSVDKNLRNKIIDISGKVEFPELVEIIKKFQMFIANDGGPMHIAASENIPTIGLFGHETPVRYAPHNKKSVGLFKTVECNPCNKAYKNQWPICTNPRCVKSISVEDVKKAIEKLNS